MWEVVVWTLVRVLIWVAEEMIVYTWVVQGLDGGFVTGFPRFVESSGKTSQTVSHFFFNFHGDVFLVSLKRRNGESGLRSLLANA